MKKKASKRKPTATKRRKPVSKTKRRTKKKDDFLGRLSGIIKIVGDIEAPVVPLEDWEALR